mmetsp:Transcript_49589/g.149457  ORF Transcript_49589/g.149457 Transcript_49589/m.149457 type:complete len:164 (-) Transcript_49589:363-854(-)|eukprot:CAMPEP_0113554106 /NCGR_PEP_ID=MMETSP0015_2-20120614/15969_1 /TAXON_ID=2838 /ORGANISM="Odontella" /LENGTH=163 /DNA_ID=CAMNT_0000455219 /DNA_START=212 /DNA_END=703 /DNA_ORIENTATION=+ /assembly_acc=CAM_ASM_000160
MTGYRCTAACLASATLLLSARSTESMALPKGALHSAESSTPASNPSPLRSRREVIASNFRDAAALAAAIPFLAGAPLPARALKEKNDALCATGFFTNIAQYRCTDIGNILDEGKSPALTQSEEVKLDSLMAKFGEITLDDGGKVADATSSKKENAGEEKKGGK